MRQCIPLNGSSKKTKNYKTTSASRRGERGRENKMDKVTGEEQQRRVGAQGRARGEARERKTNTNKQKTKQRS